MRPLVITLVIAAAGAAALPARDSADSHAPRRSSDPDRTDRLKQYLAAFHRLPAAVQVRVRKLDGELQAEKPVTRARLFGVMERYAFWLSRLSEADRERIQTAPAGPERLHVVREVLEQQWLDDLPPTRKAELAKAPKDKQTELIAGWHREENLRTQTLRATQDMAILSRDERMPKFREDVAKFVKSDLEPRLLPKERMRLQSIEKRAAPGPNYYRQVLALSEEHGLRPPGPADIWNRYRLPRK